MVTFYYPILVGAVKVAVRVRIILGYSQNHLAVAGGYEVKGLEGKSRLRTHPLPRGGSDCIQVRFPTFEASQAVIIIPSTRNEGETGGNNGGN
jgi:hypothetical protein